MPKSIKEQEKVAADALIDFSTEVVRINDTEETKTNDTEEDKTPINAETKYATSAAKEKAVKKNKTPAPIDKPNKSKTKSTPRRHKNKKVDLAPPRAGEEDVRALVAPPNTAVKKKARRQSRTLLKKIDGKLDGIDEDDEKIDGEENKDETKEDDPNNEDEVIEFDNNGDDDGGGIGTDGEDDVSI